MKKLLLLFLLFFSSICLADVLEDYKSACKDIGFKPKTEKFGDCVIEFKKRDGNSNLGQSKNSASNNQNPSDVKQCIDFGYKQGTDGFAQCLQKFSIYRQYQAEENRKYSQQLAEYQERKAAYDEEVAIQKNLKLMQFGLNMAAGTSPYASENIGNAGRMSLGLPPLPPSQPQVQNFSITNLKSGQMTHCSATGNLINCY
jgi:hypothetical protein